MLYDLDQIRKHYRRLLERKPRDYYERFDQHMLEKRPLVRALIVKAFDRLFPAKVGRAPASCRNPWPGRDSEWGLAFVDHPG
ncbi:MAG: hypothetical protein AB1726_17435 [Planctomycetota bacterium]